MWRLATGYSEVELQGGDVVRHAMYGANLQDSAVPTVRPSVGDGLRPSWLDNVPEDVQLGMAPTSVDASITDLTCGQFSGGVRCAVATNCTCLP